MVASPGSPAGGAALRAVPELEFGFAASVPVVPTPLFGREDVLDVLRSSLLDGDRRLVTLSGPGGVGKTRVAIAAATGLIGELSGAVLFVPAATVTDAAQLIDTVARATGRDDLGQQDPGDVAESELGAQPTLLVVDNLEQLPGAGGPLVGLLDRCPDLVVLTTSRRPLRVAGERVIEVAPLATPPADGPADTRSLRDVDSVKLFTEVAGSVDPSFELTSDNAAAVAAICRRLDGLPLGLELAAARSRVLAPAELARLLESHLDILRRADDRGPARHRTLWASIEGSYELLSANDQRRFRHSAVFAGGFGGEALAAVTGDDVADVLDTLGQLDEIHLVRRLPGDHDAHRFDVLETVRQFGLAKLAQAGDEAGARAAHARWFAAVAEPVEDALTTGGDPRSTLDRLDRDHDNIRAALAWLVAHDAESAMKMAAELWRFWWIRGHLREGRSWLQRATGAAPASSTGARADAEASLGDLVLELGEPAAAEAHYERARERYAVLTDHRGTARCWNGIGMVARLRSDLDRSDECHARALEIFRTEGDRRGEATARAGRGAVAYHRGDMTRAQGEWAAALDIARAIGDLRSAGPLLSNIGAARLEQGDVGGAISAHEESAAIARRLDDRSNIVQALGNLGAALAEDRQDDRAWPVLDEALGLAGRLGLAANEAVILHTVATLALRSGDLARAAAASSRGLQLFAEMGMRPASREMVDQLREIADHAGREHDRDLLAATDDAALETAVAVAREMAAALGRAPQTGTSAIAAARRAGLTAREADIAGLLVQRHTDPEIAAALFISVRTVTTHVSAILRKLGVGSRRDVAAALADK